MDARPFNYQIGIVLILATLGLNGAALADNNDGAGDLGVDYAFLLLMTLSPDFAAANYTIENKDGSDVDIAIGRLPFHIDLTTQPRSRLQFEGSVAYQRTEEIIGTFPDPGEDIDARWNTYGAGAGLLYEYNLREHLKVTPSLRAGIARMKNTAVYNGVLTQQIKDLFEGTLLNWHSNASIVSVGIGLSYDWTLLDRDSSFKADVYHIFIDSFQESDTAVKFTEHANMLAVNADMIFPTEMRIYDHRLDLVLLLGANQFLGENRRTLGYTTSYQVGMGGELPLNWGEKTYGHLRLSGQILWASNMKGWLLTIGYMPH
jgi:hypothetical protein